MDVRLAGMSTAGSGRESPTEPEEDSRLVCAGGSHIYLRAGNLLVGTAWHRRRFLPAGHAGIGAAGDRDGAG